MAKRYSNKLKNKMINVGIDLNKLESLSRILIQSIVFNDNLKSWDIENLSSILSEKILKTKHKFNDIEKIMKI
ncbi:MAG: hypothetical protein WC197_07310 [Candidatus Gastranaerophilaceae bacterium]|jgi:PBP1b-binding outer membrane lipoprotein LpoB